MNVSPVARALLSLLLVLAIAIPLGIVVALLLVPFWSWFEASPGIESIGHSGPAEWCYAVVYVVLVVGMLLVLRVVNRRAPTTAGRS